jgi:SAM-dependent methyltransferase
MKKLTKQQQKQEEGYVFPYHYTDIKYDDYKYLIKVAYLGRLKTVIKLIEKNKKVLDAGCGDGRLVYELNKAGINAEGVDYSEQAIMFARAFNPNSNFYVQSLEKLNLKKKYDIITLIETLEHIKPNEIKKIILGLSKHLKLQGKLIITVPSTNMPLAKKHYQHFNQESLILAVGDDYKLKKIFGQGKLGLQRLVFEVLWRLGVMIYPFRRILPLKWFFKFVKKYYDDTLRIGDPEKCSGLISVFEKIK